MIKPLDYTGLLEPQIDHATKLLNSLYLNGVASDTSETGTGKTYAASWIAKQINSPVVVVCPKSVIPVWNKILSSFGVTASLLINYEKLMRGNTPHVGYRKPSNKINPNTGIKDDVWKYQLLNINLPSNALIILDEAHKCKAPTSLNAGFMMALKKQGYKVLSLSATQATNPTEMRGYGFLTNLHNLYDWRKWCLENGCKENLRFNSLEWNGDEAEDTNRKGMMVCHDNLFHIQEISSRLTRDQMGNLFPENEILAEAYDLGGSNTAKIQAVYDEMEEEIAAMEEGTANYSSHVFAEIIKARRKAELLKTPLFVEMIEDFYAEGSSVVVFLNFTDTINAVSERLHHNDKLVGKIGYVYGENTYKERYQDIDDFQEDKKRVMLCNLKSGGSISLHDLRGVYPRKALLSPSFSAIDLLQALGRIFRQGGLTKCYQRIIFAAQCIEERAARRVQARLTNLSILNDGDLSAGFKLFSNN